MTERIRIGVLGCANIALKSVIPAMKEIKNLELVAVASRSKEKADFFAQTFACESIVGYENLISRKDIDAVYIPLPTGLHEEWVMKALHSNKHVFVEKSFALNYVSADAMIQLAKKKGLCIMENFMFTFHQQHQIIKQYLKDDIIGDIKLFRSTFCFPPLEETNFRYDKKLGGGALYDVGCYTLKASQLFFGNQLEILSSQLIYNEQKVDISGSVHLKSNLGIPIQLFFGFDSFYQCNYEILGTKGKITATRAFTPPKDFNPKIILELEKETKEIIVPCENHFVKILNHFVETIQSDDFQSSYEELYNQAKLIDLVQK